MRRVVSPELLDDDLGSAEEVLAALADLGRINQWFGGTRTTIALLRRVATVARAQHLTLLEVGAGDGSVPLTARHKLAAEGVTMEVTLLDRIAGHLPSNGRAVIAGDALCLPFRDGAFDVVSCSLLVHHFEPDAVRRFADEALRVCRKAVLINDLIRSQAHLALVYCGMPLYRSHLTRCDAPASVRRAYTTAEMLDLLQESSAAGIEISRHFLFRMGIVLWKEKPATGNYI